MAADIGAALHKGDISRGPRHPRIPQNPFSHPSHVEEVHGQVNGDRPGLSVAPDSGRQQAIQKGRQHAAMYEAQAIGMALLGEEGLFGEIA